MKITKSILIATILLTGFNLITSGHLKAQEFKTEFKNDTLIVDGRPIYKGLEMILGKPDKRVFEFVVMGQTKMWTSKAPSMAFYGSVVKIVSIDESKGVFSFKCKPQDALSGASKAILNAIQSLWVTDIVNALKSKELIFKD
jgi:hypothetical protein